MIKTNADQPVYYYNHLKEWRAKFGFTQETACWILGISRATLARWEKEPAIVPQYIRMLVDRLIKEESGGHTNPNFAKGAKAWLTLRGFLPPSQTGNSQEKPQPPPESSPGE